MIQAPILYDLTVEEIARDAARIEAELLSGEGTDPFAAVVRATRMPMVVTNPRLPDNPIVFTNDAFCRLTGYGREEILGRNCRFLQGSETDPDSVASIKTAIARRQPIEIELLNRHKDGTSFWNRLVIAPVYDAAGTLSYFFASQMDVTAERERLLGLESRNAALATELAGRLEEQRESQTRLQFATEAGRLGIWEIDYATGALNASPICKDIYGCDPAVAFDFAAFKTATHVEDARRVDAAFAAAASGCADIDIEYKIERLDRSIAWVKVRARVVHDENGTALRMGGIALDISERRARDLRLAVNEEVLRLATNAASIGTWDFDPTTDVLVWSDLTRAMFGMSPGEPCSLSSFLDGLHPEDRAETIAAFDAMIDPGDRRPYDIEYRTVGKEDGSVRWVAAKGRAFFDEAGRCIRAVGTAIDVTTRHAADDRQAFLFALSDKLRSTDDPVALMQISADGVGGHLSATHVAFGRLVESGLQVTFEAEFLADRTDPAFGSCGVKALGLSAGGMPGAKLRIGEDLRRGRRVLCTRWHPAGSEAVAVLPSGPSDRSPQMVLYITDRCGRRWTEDDVKLAEDVARRTCDAVALARVHGEMLRLNAHLETSVDDRTAELRQTEEQLRHAHKMEAVGQLTGGIAHDFNNLLMGVSGNLDLLSMRLGQGRLGELDRYLEAAQGAATRAAALTHRLLAFARRQTLDPVATDVNMLVRDFEDLIRRTVGPAVSIVVVGREDLWTALVDRNQLENALLNLCINARDAMPLGGALTIATDNETVGDELALQLDVLPGPYLVLRVTDTGTGMKPSVIARAFDPFFTTKPTGEGTGLGLSMIYGFVRQSSGQVRIESQTGVGTTMHVYLPRHHERPVRSAPDVSAIGPPRAEIGETVLVIDDETGIRALVAESLEELGYVCIEAKDGFEGLRVLQTEGRIDLLITDVGLPGGMNGRQVADAARASRPDLKVLFITGYAGDRATGERGLDGGMKVMTKPFTLDALAVGVKGMLSTPPANQGRIGFAFRQEAVNAEAGRPSGT